MTEQDETAAPLALAEGFAPRDRRAVVGPGGRGPAEVRRARRGARPRHRVGAAQHHDVRRRAHPSALHRRRPVPDSGFPGVAPYVRGSRPTGLGRQGWDVRQHFADPDPAVTRQAVLTDLENGVTSLWLEVGASRHRAPATCPRCSRDVLLDLAPVVLDAGADTPDAAAQLMAAVARPARGPGRRDGQPRPRPARPSRPAPARAPTCPPSRPLVSQAAGRPPAGAGDDRRRACPTTRPAARTPRSSGCAARRRRRLPAGAGRTAADRAEVACGQLEFRYAATADQFLTIAKLRAARRLWARVAEAVRRARGRRGPGAARRHVRGR